MQLSPNFTLEEMTVSDWAARHGVSNKPDVVSLANLKRTAAALEQVRGLLGDKVIIVHSGYRSPVVNAGVGGVPTSAHCRGLACDFVCPSFGSNAEVARALQASDVNFDQLILEYGWVHIGFAEVMKAPRREVMTKLSPVSPYTQGINA